MMKSTFAIATLAGVSSAVSTETMSALMQHASFGGIGRGERFGGVQNPFGQNSNVNDSDIRRQNPDFANPARKGEVRPLDDDPHLEDDYVPLAVRNAQAAIKDPILARQPDVRPLYEGSYDMEPIDYSNKKFLSPVFLVDPMFTMGSEDKDKNQLFIDNDFGGWKRPVNPSKWPIISNAVQDFFGVGPDCTCKKTHKAVFALIPKV